MEHLRPASDFIFISGGRNNRPTPVDAPTLTPVNPTASLQPSVEFFDWKDDSSVAARIILAIAFVFALFQMIIHLGMITSHASSFARDTSSKYPQFHTTVFLIGFTGFMIFKGIMLMWILNSVPGDLIQGVLFDLTTYWSLWVLIAVLLVKRLVSLPAIFSQRSGFFKSIKSSPSKSMEFPDIFIVMTIFHEPLNVLMNSVDSIIHSDYPSKRIHLIMVFDEDTDGLDYILFLKRVNLFDSVLKTKFGDTTYEGVRLIVSKFKHTGKQASQKHGIELVRRYFGQDPSISVDPIILFCDSDVILDRNAMHNAASVLSLNEAYVSVSGSRSIRNTPFKLIESIETLDFMSKELLEWPLQQRMETLHNLPGYMLFVRFAAFRDIELKYFANLESSMSTSKYHRITYADHLHLQNLLVENYGTRRFGYSSDIRGFQNAPYNWSAYFYEKRRHFLGYLANVCGLVGSRKMMVNSPMLYLSWLWDLVSMSSSLSIFSLLLTCLFSGSYSIAQLVLLMSIPLLNATIVFVHASFAKKGAIGAMYLVHSLIIKPVIDVIVLIFVLATFSWKTWGRPRDSPASQADQLYEIGWPKGGPMIKKMKGIAGIGSDVLFESRDDEALLENATRPSVVDHQIIESLSDQEESWPSKKRMELSQLFAKAEEDLILNVPAANASENKDLQGTSAPNFVTGTFESDIFSALDAHEIPKVKLTELPPSRTSDRLPLELSRVDPWKFS